MSFIRSVSGGVLMAIALTSCVAPPKESDGKDVNGKKIVEYVYYTPTGSNVPVRVLKEQLKTPDSDAEAQQKALTDLQRESAADKSPSAGGK
jgi:hypothetical protein